MGIISYPNACFQHLPLFTLKTTHLQPNSPYLVFSSLLTSTQEMFSGLSSFKMYFLNLCTPWPLTHNLLLNFGDITITRPHCFSWVLLLRRLESLWHLDFFCPWIKCPALGWWVAGYLWVESGPRLPVGTKTLVNGLGRAGRVKWLSTEPHLLTWPLVVASYCLSVLLWPSHPNPFLARVFFFFCSSYFLPGPCGRK